MSDTATSQVIWAEQADNAAVADHIAQIIAQPAQSGRHRLAVPGGSTPIPIFADLSARDLPWGSVEMMLTDDRQVPAGHEASNQSKLEAALAPTGAAIHALEAGMTTGHFDLVWLGMGADGHIASLFPQMECEQREGAAVIATTPDPLPPEAPFARLSLNMAALTDADAIMLVVRGDAKKRVLEAAIAGESDLPIAQLLTAATCPVTIFWSEA